MNINTNIYFFFFQNKIYKGCPQKQRIHKRLKIKALVSKLIALDKALFSTKKYLYFSYFSTKTYVVGTH